MANKSGGSRRARAAPARALPTGTVTFLLTDGEGSTRLLQSLGGETYAEALAEHRRLLRDAFTRHGGVEVDTQGDAFFVAFATAQGAVAAADEAQKALTNGPIRVRMGIHTGTPVLTEEGYVGPDVHRAARIAGSGHGGQVLVSSATAALVGRDRLTDLGEHRLKDLTTPERIYQVGTAEFPPLRTLHRTNLPVPTTTFLRVVVAEDVMLTRKGLVDVLTNAGIEVVAAVADPDALLRAVAAERPDAAIVDIRMPPTHTDEGLRAASEIRAKYPQVGVLVLSQYVEPAYALRLIEEVPESVGYLLKERVVDGAVLVDALRRLSEGECVVDPTIVSRLVRRRRRSNPLDELTDRERDVLSLLAEGLSNVAISNRLFVTERTVEAHTKQIFEKLRLDVDAASNRRVLAVLTFLRAAEPEADA